MLTATQHALTLRALARVLAAWLVAIVCVQGWAAAEGLVRGALHLHAGAPLQAQAHDHGHAHAGWQRHLHSDRDAGDAGTLSADGAAADGLGAGGLLALCLAGALFARWRGFAAAGRHALPCAGRSSFHSQHPRPPHRPPRG
jgi:hypothetical protein